MPAQRSGTKRSAEKAVNLTPAEAAFVADLSRKAVEQAIDRGEVQPVEERRRGGVARRLDESAVVYLRIRNEAGDLLSAKARREVYRALRARGSAASRLNFGPLSVSTTNAFRIVRERLRCVRRARIAVEVDPEIRGGEPVVRGTRIPVRMLADLAKAGEARERILEDYPALDSQLLEDALLYASLYPRRGRPRRAPWRDRKPRGVFRAGELGPNR